ncbi:hypothetical protein E1B28_010905 [Marasmius oreades]|uniref:Uncharacterized protein n=1 Tax=Marasmius oreades TaxID=181124 RepID=A0A9P7RUC9_9AGAR|nr:uncharacterized protein E1B28_010905 [Marasmius oreades]KAG7089203.1 hypothetical protein E1B28_010905 [Marasmius oreades]
MVGSDVARTCLLEAASLTPEVSRLEGGPEGNTLTNGQKQVPNSGTDVGIVSDVSKPHWRYGRPSSTSYQRPASSSDLEPRRTSSARRTGYDAEPLSISESGNVWNAFTP